MTAMAVLSVDVTAFGTTQNACVCEDVSGEISLRRRIHPDCGWHHLFHRVVLD